MELLGGRHAGRGLATVGNWKGRWLTCVFVVVVALAAVVVRVVGAEVVGSVE